MKPDKTLEGLYIALLAAALSIGLAIVAWYEIRHNTTDGALETMFAIVQRMQGVIVFSTVTIYVSVQGGQMLAERYLRRRFYEGREEGLKEGRAERDAAWSAWYERMLDAQSRGEPFDEPPPGTAS